jgi:hypothetical protein
MAQSGEGVSEEEETVGDSVQSGLVEPEEIVGDSVQPEETIDISRGVEVTFNDNPGFFRILS